MTKPRSNSWTKTFWLRFFVVAIFCLSGCRSLEDHFIYNPDVYPHGWNDFSGHPIEEAWFTAEDGTRLHGIFAAHEKPKAIILFAHGRRGNVTSFVYSLLSFVDRHQVSVLVFDYRGFGRSEGQPTETGLYQDARAALAWLAKKTNRPKSEIMVMGRSLGAAVATELAASENTKALIVESGFTSLPGFVSHHVPIIPAERILFSNFDSLDRISNYHGPVMISHGTKDRVIPFSQGQDLFKAAPGPKHFFTVVDGGHEWKSGPQYHAAMDKFLDYVNTLDR